MNFSKVFELIGTFSFCPTLSEAFLATFEVNKKKIAIWNIKAKSITLTHYQMNCSSVEVTFSLHMN